MTAGQWLDRAINAAVIAAGTAANRMIPPPHMPAAPPAAPPAVDGEAGAAGADASAMAGTGGRPTSELLREAALRIRMSCYGEPASRALVADLNDRASCFEAHGD